METKKIHSCICLLFIILFGCSGDTSVTQNYFGLKISAADKYDEVVLLANPDNEGNGLVLESIRSDYVDINGNSNKWIYSFSSAGIAFNYYYHATAISVALDSISIDNKFPPIELISHEWIDSNEAVKIADDNGGKTFRNNHNNYNIEIKLEEPLGYNGPTIWHVTFYSKQDRNINLSFVIDATSGEIL